MRIKVVFDKSRDPIVYLTCHSYKYLPTLYIFELRYIIILAATRMNFGFYVSPYND